MVMTPFGNCFSAGWLVGWLFSGMCLRIKMSYMLTGSVLQVFLQKVMCYSRYATFKHEKPGCGAMMVMYMFYA